MTDRANTTELLLFRRQQNGFAIYSLMESPHSEPVFGLVKADCNLEVDAAGALTVCTDDRHELDLQRAVETGIVEVTGGQTASALKQLFQMAMYNEVRADLIFRLLRTGENALEWDLETDDDAIWLIDAQGRTRARVENPFWWQVHDTEFVAELAHALVAGAGLLEEAAVH
jgi:hypothetical protein